MVSKYTDLLLRVPKCWLTVTAGGAEEGGGGGVGGEEAGEVGGEVEVKDLAEAREGG